MVHTVPFFFFQNFVPDVRIKSFVAPASTTTELNGNNAVLNLIMENARGTNARGRGGRGRGGRGRGGQGRVSVTDANTRALMPFVQGILTVYQTRNSKLDEIMKGVVANSSMNQ